jgi:hypothetical protein
MLFSRGGGVDARIADDLHGPVDHLDGSQHHTGAHPANPINHPGRLPNRFNLICHPENNARGGFVALANQLDHRIHPVMDECFESTPLGHVHLPCPGKHIGIDRAAGKLGLATVAVFNPRGIYSSW